MKKIPSIVHDLAQTTCDMEMLKNIFNAYILMRKWRHFN